MESIELNSTFIYPCSQSRDMVQCCNTIIYKILGICQEMGGRILLKTPPQSHIIIPSIFSIISKHYLKEIEAKNPYQSMTLSIKEVFWGLPNTQKHMQAK
ncbi:MAG: hypothetical protein ACFFFT_11185 [Candidatus Thorarchaeota archaeon]